MRTCQQCGKIFYNITDKDVICDFCKKRNEKELRHLSRSNNLNTCISKIFLIDNVIYSNYFLPLLVKYKINQSAAIRKLIEYAVAHPDILTDKIELKNDISLVDKFVNYFIQNIDTPITKTYLTPLYKNCLYISFKILICSHFNIGVSDKSSMC